MGPDPWRAVDREELRPQQRAEANGPLWESRIRENPREEAPLAHCGISQFHLIAPSIAQVGPETVRAERAVSILDVSATSQQERRAPCSMSLRMVDLARSRELVPHAEVAISHP